MLICVRVHVIMAINLYFQWYDFIFTSEMNPKRKKPTSERLKSTL